MWFAHSAAAGAIAVVAAAAIVIANITASVIEKIAKYNFQSW